MIQNLALKLDGSEFFVVHFTSKPGFEEWFERNVGQFGPPFLKKQDSKGLVWLGGDRYCVQPGLGLSLAWNVERLRTAEEMTTDGLEVAGPLVD